MATLVLGTIGSALGGPIGGALGALVGNAIDHDLLFAAPGRTGPRLSDLHVQTSSYGTPIPQLFGAMRVAGTVIWSTDLIESRATQRAGKGQPSTTTYSYSASFAVALSSRPILSVGRIWADGNLLRGSAGDFKTSTGFRLHLGDEDQAPDPLIAAAEGAALAPAHRGIAYAVFEDMALGDFGNRIPSLTFELFADPGPVAVGAIAEALAPGIVEDRGVAATLAGFAASGETLRPVLELLAQAGGGWFAPDGERLAFLAPGTAPLPIADEGASASGRRGRKLRSLAPADTAPRRVQVAHYDPARDFQIGVQAAIRPGPGHAAQRVDLPAALGADAAKTLATALIARAEAARDRRKVALDGSGIAVAPGALVSLPDDAGPWRVTDASLEAMVVTLDLVRLAAAQLPASAAPGRVLGAPDRAIGTTIVHAFELPAIDGAVLTQPKLYIAAAGTGTGWRAASLLHSLDGGARWQTAGSTAAPALLGTLASGLPAGVATLVDRSALVEIELLHAEMALANADGAGLDAGANLALLGDELVQFGRAERLSPTRWRLGELWRGRFGSDPAAAAAGARFVLIERDALAELTLPLAALGGTVELLASGPGDATPAVAIAPVTGASVLPLAPVHLAAEPGADTLTVSWVRRSRAGWRWIDGADAPLAEESERYRVALLDAAGATLASLDSTVPQLALDPGALPPGGTRWEVRQLGTCGASRPASAPFPA